MKPTWTFLCLVCFTFFLSSCVKDRLDVQIYHYSDSQYEALKKVLDLPANPYDYKVRLPQHLMAFTFNEQAVSNDKATLGRVLFYDKQLSRTQTVSCASCHDQKLAFSDDVAFSKGFDGRTTRRNSLALGAVSSFAATYQDGGSSFGNDFGARFFWDERAGSVEEQSTQTIQDDIEMGMPLSEVVTRIRDQEHYKVLFEVAFGSDEISETRMLEAISDFIKSMGSFNSRFDKEMVKNQFNFFNDFTGYSDQENQGKKLYMDNCASCHGHTMGRPNRLIANNGLDMEYEDNGVGEFRRDGNLNGFFKVPPLRNITLTAPYMHDGRFNTLEEVVDHYSTGVKNHPNLSDELRNTDPGQGHGPRNLNLSNLEKASLVAFLKTLTDPGFINDEKFSDPFK